MNTWIIIGIAATGLIASLYFSISKQRETAEELATVNTQLNEQMAKAEAAVTVLAGERSAMNDMARRLKELEIKRDALSDTLLEEQIKREQLERDNAEYETWAGGRLPDAAIRMLSESPLNPDNRSGAMQQREGTDDTSVAPEPKRDDPQPGPSGPDRPVRRSPDNSQRSDGSD